MPRCKYNHVAEMYANLVTYERPEGFTSGIPEGGKCTIIWKYANAYIISHSSEPDHVMAVGISKLHPLFPRIYNTFKSELPCIPVEEGEEEEPLLPDIQNFGCEWRYGHSYMLSTEDGITLENEFYKHSVIVCMVTKGHVLFDSISAEIDAYHDEFEMNDEIIIWADEKE